MAKKLLAPTKCELEKDTYYRTMSQDDYEHLKATGKLKGTSETFISPTQSYSEGYDGVTVKFDLKAGTVDSLLGIGVSDNSAQTKNLGLPSVRSGWKDTNAYFKGEGNQVNIGLGSGRALDIFNSGIDKFKKV